MNRTNSKVRYVWAILGGMLSISLLLAGCGTSVPPTREPDVDATADALQKQVHQLETQIATTADPPPQESPVPPTDEPDCEPTVSALEEQVRQLETQIATTSDPPPQESPVPPTGEPDCQEESTPKLAVLEMSGTGEKGMPVTLRVTANDARVEPRFNTEAMSYLTKAYTQTAYVEYALVHDGGTNWRLYYAQPPTGVITPTRVQMHLVESEDASQPLFTSSPDFAVSASIPITFLFSVGFRQAFEDHGISLSENVTIEEEVEGSRWRIDDTDQGHTYMVMVGDETLNIYSAFLFSVGLEFQSDLEQGVPSVGFRQAFEDHGISLSENVTNVTIEEEVEGSRWRIDDTDQGHTYTVIVGDETLNIYSATDEAGSPILLQDGVKLINNKLGEHLVPGTVLPRPTAFLLLSDGAIDQPQYRLVIFDVQPDGQQLYPGDDDDLESSCNRLRPPWWCVLITRLW